LIVVKIRANRRGEPLGVLEAKLGYPAHPVKVCGRGAVWGKLAKLSQRLVNGEPTGFEGFFEKFAATFWSWNSHQT
jgi:hypothetical protein